LREKLQALVALQKVDLEIAALRKSTESYPRDIAELEKQLAGVQSAVAAERAKLDDLDRQRSTLEQTIAQEKEKVRKWEARLSDQRTTREYSALAREIDIAKKGQQTMSEQLVELGKQAAAQRETVKSKDAELGGKTKDLVDKISALKAKLAEVEAQVKAIDGKRHDAASKVAPDLLRRYETVRKKRMPAMVPLAPPEPQGRNAACTGCRMAIRAQLYNTLLNSLGYDVCPSCQRIIYVEAAVSPSPAK